MAQAVLERVLNDIHSLEATELSSVEAALNTVTRYPEGRATLMQMDTEHGATVNHSTLGYDSNEWEILQTLVSKGLMLKIQPKVKVAEFVYSPVPIQGKPLSETIIEERR